MKTFLRYILLISLIGMLFECDEDEVTSRNYPRLNTLPVSDINSEGAMFNAELIFRGSFEVINYGFVWGQDESPNLLYNDDRIIYSDNLQDLTFSAFVNRSLKKDDTFYVRAFIETDQYLVYGQSIEFVSLGSQPPKITALSPIEGTVGDTLNIIGRNFSNSPASNKVLIDNLEALIISSSDSLLKTIVPYKLKSSSSKISVTLFGNQTTSEQDFKLSSPKINSFNPDQGSDSTIVLISGNDFSIVPELNLVKFDDKYAKVLTSTKNQIEVVVPSGLKYDMVELSVTVADQTEASNQLFSMLPPGIRDFNPKEALCGESIIIEGENFGTNFGSVQVYFNELKARILKSNSKRIEVAVPSGLNSPTIIKAVAFEQESSHSALFIPNLDLPSNPNDGLVFSFPFDNSTRPVIGSCLCWPLGVGDYISDRNGNDSFAYYLDGTEHLELGTQPVFSLGNYSEFTISFWLNPSHLDLSSDQTILSQFNIANGQNGRYYLISLFRNQISFEIFKDGTSVSEEIVNSINQGWQHYSWVYKDQSMKVFVNGEEKNNMQFSFPIKQHFNGYAPAVLGSNFYSQAGAYRDYFTGSIDQLKIYNRQLSDEEIFALYINESCE